MASDTLLCGSRGSRDALTIATYASWEGEPDQGWSKKPGFIQRRLFERYVEPVRALDMHSDTKERKNGFYIMAVSCLLVETLESFWQGWETTEPRKDAAGRNVPSKSKEAFRLFFARQGRFGMFIDTDFYKARSLRDTSPGRND